ncbi:MAG TPA: hypothetical protein VIC08_01370 [Cellvibrionaceae bacterium]
MRRRRKTCWQRQLGQSMAEYTVVMAALVGGLLVANKGACPNVYEDCIEYLLTVMHDNYDGYSSSISAVHQYDRDYEYSDGGEGWEDNPGDDPGGDPGGDPGVLPDPPPVAPATVLQSADGSITYGTVDAEGNVSLNNEVIGFYDQATGEYVDSGGVAIVGVVVNDVIIDADGNVLELTALVDCVTGVSYGFGYESQVNGNFYDALQYKEVNSGSYCTAPSYPVYLSDGTQDGGRVVNGLYYASIYSGGLPSPMQPTGEVVYFAEFDECVVMVTGWDEGILAENEDEDDIYEAMIELWQETPAAENPALATMAPGQCNASVANREVAAP